MRHSNLTILNFIYLFFALSWKAVNMLTYNIDGKSRILFVFTVIVLLANLMSSKSFRNVLTGKPAIIWLLWIIYNSINMHITGYSAADVGTFSFFVINRLFCPLLCMTLIINEYSNSPNATLKVVLYGLSVFSIIGAYLMYTNPLGGVSLGNDLALYAMFIPFVGGLLYLNKELGRLGLIILSALTIVLVVFSAERKALGGLLIILVSLVFVEGRLKPRNIVFILLFSAILYWGMGYIMDNTLMGSRIKGYGTDTSWMADTDANTERFAIFGTRAYFYAKGLDLFHAHPINGIGLTNFTYAANYDLRIHSEYMVQLTECGIIGSLLFLLFYLNIFKHVNKFRRNTKTEKRFHVLFYGGVISILFVAFTTWEYECREFFVVLGLIIGHIKCTQLQLYEKE